MPLPIIEFRDPTTMLQTLLDSTIEPATTTAHPQIDKGWILKPGQAQDSGSGYRPPAYDFINDRLIFYTQTRVTSPTQESARSGILVWDSQGLNGTTPRNGFVDDATLGSTSESNLNVFIAGEPNLQTSTQKFYNLCLSGGAQEFDPDNLTTGSALWPNTILGGGAFQRSAISVSSTLGYYIANPAGQDTDVLIFESLTDSSGMADVVLGGSSHAEGLALVKCLNASITGTNSHTGAWIWVDLDTGNCVGFLNVPSQTTGGALPTSEPRVDGQAFQWRRGQFVPDPGSTVAAPKGEFHCYSDEFDGRIAVPIAETSGTGRRHYVTVYDFNPFGIGSAPTRVHGRRVFLGVIDIPTAPIAPGGQTLALSDENMAVFYHQASRSYFCWQGASDNTAGNTNETPESGDWVVQRWRRAFVPDEVISVTPTSEVTENSVVRYRGIVLTDLNEPAGGVAVSITLRRVSTRDEQFDGTALGSGNYVVDAGEIDNNGTLEVYEGGGIDSGGTLLIETTDYTVNYGTGTLTPVGSWPTDTISVRYHHFDVPLSPGHGTLLTSNTTTDGSGAAFAFVTYGDNLDGEWDRVDFTA